MTKLALYPVAYHRIANRLGDDETHLRVNGRQFGLAVQTPNVNHHGGFAGCYPTANSGGKISA